MSLVKRYCGEPLRPGSRIAVFANDALGNFVVCTPLLEMIRRVHAPSTLDFFGGVRTSQLQAKSDLIDRHFPWCGAEPRELETVIAERGCYDLVVNVEGTPEAKAATAIACGPDTLICGPCFAPGTSDDYPLANDLRGRLQADPDCAECTIVPSPSTASARLDDPPQSNPR